MLQRDTLLFYDGNILPLHHSIINRNHNTPTSSICIFYPCTTPPYLGSTTHLPLPYLYLSLLDCSNAPSLFNDGNLPPVHHSTILKSHNTPTSSICIFYTVSSFAPLPSYSLYSRGRGEFSAKSAIHFGRARRIQHEVCDPRWRGEASSARSLRSTPGGEATSARSLRSAAEGRSEFGADSAIHFE